MDGLTYNLFIRYKEYRIISLKNNSNPSSEPNSKKDFYTMVYNLNKCDF